MRLERLAEDFKGASDELRRPVTLQEIADECGVPVGELNRAMLAEGSEAYLPPPRFWKGDLAFLARQRAGELVELADELEASAFAPPSEDEVEEIGSMIAARFDQILQPKEELAHIEKRREDFEARREEIEKRRAARKRQQSENLDELNQMFLNGILRNR